MDRRSFLTAARYRWPPRMPLQNWRWKAGRPSDRPLVSPNWGPLYYDDQEQAQLTQVLESRKPFRFANSLEQSKVAIFEKEYAARMQTKYALAVTSGTAALHMALAAWKWDRETR